MKTDITMELVQFIIGDTQKVTRLSFPKIMELFNDVHNIGEKDTVTGVYPNQILLIKGEEVPYVYSNRKKYAEMKLNSINDSIKIEKLFENIVNFKANIPQEQLVEEFKKFIPPTYNFVIKNSKYILESSIDFTNPEQIDERKYDRDIKPQIEQDLNNAKFLIWVNVYQFTDKDFRVILEKKHFEGVDVQVIISDDQTSMNNLKDVKFPVFIRETEHITDRAKSIGHSKNAVIDIKISYSGSYNWTYNAALRNDEENNRYENNLTHIQELTERFISIRNKAKKLKP